jgi:7-cyano-7-deazaguanine reductase
VSTRPSSNPSKASTKIDTFDNPQQDRDYTIRIDTPEFTCLCPLTSQPDFATILIEYIADKKCLELKALKMYFWSYRDQGAFHEAVTNKMLSDFVDAIEPRFMRVSADFNVRGGFYTKVIAEHRAEGWVAPEPVTLP